MARTEVVRDYGGVSAAERRDRRRAKLLGAGRRLWGRSGISAVTVRGVCAEAGLTPRYFYEHFAHRDALIAAVSDDVRDELLDLLVTAGTGDPGTVTDKLRSALTSFLEIIEDDPHIHRIATTDLTGVPGLETHREHFRETVTELVVTYAPDALDGPVPSAAQLRRGALFIVGGVNQIIEQWLTDPVESASDLAAQCADLSVAVVRETVRGSRD